MPLPLAILAIWWIDDHLSREMRVLFHAALVNFVCMAVVAQETEVEMDCHPCTGCVPLLPLLLPLPVLFFFLLYLTAA